MSYLPFDPIGHPVIESADNDGDPNYPAYLNRQLPQSQLSVSSLSAPAFGYYDGLSPVSSPYCPPSPSLPSGTLSTSLTSRQRDPTSKKKSSSSATTNRRGKSPAGYSKRKIRGGYLCGYCKVPKKGHDCPFIPRLKKDPNIIVETRDMSCQVEIDKEMRLSELPCGYAGHRMGCVETYTAKGIVEQRQQMMRMGIGYGEEVPMEEQLLHFDRMEQQQRQQLEQLEQQQLEQLEQFE